MERKSGECQVKRVVSQAASPLTLPVAADSCPRIEVIGLQPSWPFSWKLLPHKMPLHLRGTGTSLAEGPAELP